MGTPAVGDLNETQGRTPRDLDDASNRQRNGTMYKLLLCSRYLRTRYIALASIISVMLGVATMIVVNSVMAGFSTQMRERIHGILADLVMEVNGTDGAPNPEASMEKIRKVAGKYIESMSPVVEIYGMVSFQWRGQYITKPVTLIGIEPESKSQVGVLKDHLKSFQPELDASGKVLHPAARSLSEPPNWDLAEAYQRYRRIQVQNQIRWNHQTEAAEQDVEMPQAEAVAKNPAAKVPVADGKTFPFFPDATDLKTAEKPFASTDIFDDPTEPKELSLEEREKPLAGRLYVGLGVVSFQYENQRTGKLETEVMAVPGDDIAISTVSAGRPPEVVHFTATIVDTFQSGMSEYDANLVFCNLEYLQEMRGMFNRKTGERSFTSIQIKLKDYNDADKVVSLLRSSAEFPVGLFSVQTWESKQGPLLAAVSVESAILNVLLFLIIAVAGFGILAIFFMIVVEKTRDIGILKALGASSGGVQSIFLGYGLALGIVGSGVGMVSGLIFVWNINTIESWLTWMTGHKVFDQRIYYFPTIPTSIQPLMVFWVAFGAMSIAVLASILPARRAARMHPVQCLRYE
jgi:lipoprotein-releasing system permease protein